MKTIFSTIALFSAVLFATSCTEDMEYKDSKVSSVNQLYEPTDGKEVVLQSSASASLFFEWESAKAEDSGAPLYEVVFDKEGGDFSKPIYKVLSDNGGSLSYATISHKTLNKVGAAAGLNSGETGTLVWTVMASRGLNSVMAKESKKLTITRLVGFEEIPAQLYLTGSATEGGMDAAMTALSTFAPGSLPREGTSICPRWQTRILLRRSSPTGTAALRRSVMWEIMPMSSSRAKAPMTRRIGQGMKRCWQNWNRISSTKAVLNFPERDRS